MINKFCRSKKLVKKFRHTSLEPTNTNSLKVHKFLEPTKNDYEDLGTSVIYSPMSPPYYAW